MSFKSRLKEARLNLKLTQKSVADQIGVGKSTYAGYETGNSEPKMDVIIKLVSILHVDPNYLLQDEMTAINHEKTLAPEIEVDEQLQGIINCYHAMDDTGQETLAEQAEFLLSKHPKSKDVSNSA